MFSWFKKTLKPKCQHYKSAGQPYPENMKQLIRFSNYPKEIDPFGHSLNECTICGVRSFGCSACNMMNSKVTAKVDQFIAHKITFEDLIEVFKANNYWYEIKED